MEGLKRAIAERLGGPRKARCPECDSEFLVDPNQLWYLTVFVDGEISDDEDDQLDFFCCPEHMERYLDRANARQSARRSHEPHYAFLSSRKNS